jgi:hypothetical protein
VKLIDVTGLLIASVASSAALAATEQIPADRTITQVRTYSWGAAIHFTPAFTNGQGCAGAVANSTVFIDYNTDANMKSLYAAALAAYLAGKRVGFGIDGCQTNYGGGTPKTYRIDVNE